MIIDTYKVGDLVYYSPHSLIREQEKKIIGAVVEVLTPTYKLFESSPRAERQPDFEYKVVWFKTGRISSILGFNLKKLNTN